MTPQFIAAAITAVGIVAMIAIFLFVLSRSGEEVPYDDLQPRAHGLRKQLFIVLLVGFFVVPILTLRDMPYSASAEGSGATIIDVMAHQWYWTLSQQEVAVGRPVVFRVGSADVNHGFGIYDETNLLIAQVQAMPGYVNGLAVKFDNPGTYKIMCLEYCGLSHHGMVAELEVVTAPLEKL